nr:hypothetical protein BaRGS_035076 [Batillaria attramentaria]
MGNATGSDVRSWEYDEEEAERIKVQFVSSMAETLKWTSLFIVYDEEHEHLVKMLTSEFSGIVYQLALTSPDANDTYVKQAIMDTIMTRDSIEALFICSAECIYRVLQMALSLEKEFKKRVSIVKSTKWLLVPSGEEDVVIFDKIFSMGFDNVGVVSSPRLLSPEFQASMYVECLPLVVSTLLWKANKMRELSPVGHFCREDGAVIMSDIFPNSNFGFNGRHFLVSTLTWDGYMMKEVINGTTHYYGLCADLLDELARTLNFTYTYTEPADQVWGHQDNGVWTGLVGQLNRQEVDMTMAPLTISKIRETAMDFTYPFYHDFTSVLLKRPDPNASKWRTYIDIFRWEVLMFIGLALLGGSVLGIAIDLVERVIFRKRNLWISFNSGNLIAFLTVTKDKAPFDTLEDMVQQDDYTYGTIDESVWTTLFAHVKEGGYAYIADMGLFQYWLATNCDLMVIKEKFFPARYGAGLPQNSAYTKLFSDQIMKIYENGLMGVWVKRWWPKRSFCAGSLTTEARALHLMDTQSVFYLAGVGFGISFAFLAAELVYSVFRPKPSEPPPPPQADKPDKSLRRDDSDEYLTS